MPLFNGSLFAEYRAAVSDDWEGYGNVGAYYNGKRWGWPTGTPVLPSYTLADLNAGISSPHYSLDVSVRDLFESLAQLTSYVSYGSFAQVARPRTW